MQKPTPPAKPVKNRNDAEQLLGAIAKDTGDLKILNDNLAVELTRARLRLQFLREDLEKRLKENYALLEQFAVSQRKTVFAEKKSLVLAHGTIGFRTGPPQLKLLSRWTWDKVLLGLTGAWVKYVRNKPDVNRQAILADAAAEPRQITDAALSKMGVKVFQAEAFYLELKS